MRVVRDFSGNRMIPRPQLETPSGLSWMISPSKRRSLGVNDWVAVKELKHGCCYEKSVLFMMHLCHGESLEVFNSSQKVTSGASSTCESWTGPKSLIDRNSPNR